MRALPEAFFRNRETAVLRRAAIRCLEAALGAADASAAIHRSVRREGDVVTVGGKTYDLGQVGAVYALGGGKAAGPMAAALEEILGDRLTGGVVSVKYGHATPTARVRVMEAAHPLPDAASIAAADAVLALVHRAGEGDLVFILLSGGGSALLTSPAHGVTLEDKLAVTRLLLDAGAPIGDLNTVRKHLSRIKGGWLARHIAPARSVTLALSDVLGNSLDLIASGPTVPDLTTFDDALAVLRWGEVLDDVPQAVADHLRAGAAGLVPETPKPGDPIFRNAQTIIVGDLSQVLRAAAEAARGEGFTTAVLSTAVEGEAREVGAALGRRARAAHEGRYGPLPVCLLQGGEPTVTVRGGGKGGRNQEVVLGAALEIDGLPRTLILSAGTDGTDGPTDAAGAVADGTTIARARRLGLAPRDHLDRNDAYPFFAALGDLLMTGPTLTNVNDLMLALVGDVPSRGATG